jgi:glycerol-3-phosphate dehydrogenase
LGQDFGHGLSAREVDYLCAEEWAEEVDDILWRRTKLGLLFSEGQKAQLEAYLAQRRLS